MLELVQAFRSGDILLLWAVVVSLLMTFLWRYPKYRHKRYRSKILFLAFIFCVIGTIYLFEFTLINIAAILFALGASCFLVAFYSARKSLFPERRAISHLENLIREGRYTEIEKRLPQRHLYIRSTPGKIEWGLLWARKLMAQEPPRLKEAYEVYYKLLKFPLFEDEEQNIRLKQALVLLLLGDTNKAKPIFERTRQKVDQGKYYECLHLQSLFDEREGEFEKARQNLLSAVSEHDDVKDLQLAIIYNNLGRMDKVTGNMTNVLHYYRKSAEYARHFKETHLIHVVYPNIIDTYLLLRDRKNAGLFLDTYAGLIDEDNIDDRLQFNNYMLAYARQTENRALFLETLVKGRVKILPAILATERLCFEASELRIRWSHQCGWDEKLFWMRNYLPKYLELEFPLRYHVIKEIFNILYDLAKKNSLGPFEGMFSELLDFMGRSKTDIDRYLLELPDYCVDERCSWEKEKAFLRKVQRKDEPQANLIDYCEGVFEHLSNIKDIQLQHGNPLAAVEADLNIAEECMGIAKEVRERAITVYLRKVMQKHLDNACKDLEKFRHHPASNEYTVRIARYALFLDDRERAKEYFDDFIQSKISIYHYALWVQGYWQELVKAFAGMDADQ